MNDGGLAFPVDYIDRSGAIPRHVVSEEMTKRDYFAAHAPATPWPHYKPKMPPFPNLGLCKANEDSSMPGHCWQNETDAVRAVGEDGFTREGVKERAEWKEENARQYWLQWPYFYADAMLAERSKQ